MSTSPTADRHRAAAAALELLSERFPDAPGSVGPRIEAAANAAHVAALPPDKRAALRTNPIALDELQAALRLVPAWLDDVDSAIRALIVAARLPQDPDDPASKPVMTWQAIGLLLGFPPNSAKQRAQQRARRLGIKITPERGD